MKAALKKLIIGSRWEEPVRNFIAVPVPLRIINFVFQRILRYNGKLPWALHFTSIVSCPRNIRIGRGVKRYFAVSGHCYFQAYNGIEIGDDTIIAPGVKIISANHDFRDFSATRESPVRIGRHCWLGTNVVILPGVELGDNVMVAAGAVVTRSFGSNLLIGGVPARVIKTIDKPIGADRERV